jgi:hypothetical protein
MFSVERIRHGRIFIQKGTTRLHVNHWRQAMINPVDLVFHAFHTRLIVA